MNDPCPYGCGNITDDKAGGPCSDCWDALWDDTAYDRGREEQIIREAGGG